MARLVMKHSGLTLALHGGVSGREEWPTLYGHHAACLGQLGCTPSGRKEGHNWCHVCYIHIHRYMCIHTIPQHIYPLHTHTWNRSRVMMLSLLPWSTIPFRLGFPLRTTWNISRKNRREYWYRKYTCGGEKSIIQ